MNYVPKEYNLGQVRGTKWFVVNATAATAPEGARVGDIILNGSTEEITIGSQWNTAGLAAGGYAKILSVQSQETNDPFKIEAADKHGNIRGVIGPKGDTGKAGNTWFTGQGEPDTGLGVPGDLYLDTENADVWLYEEDTWMRVANIFGPRGNGIFLNTINYAVGTSGTKPPESGWVAADPNLPVVNQGQYLWARSEIEYTDGGKDTIYSAAYQAVTPHIGGNGNWWIGSADTGVKAEREINHARLENLDYQSSGHTGFANAAHSHGIADGATAGFSTNDFDQAAKNRLENRTTGYVFDTVDELDSALNNYAFCEQLTIGDNFYIRALGVPDYWWDGGQKQVLETEKVDLSGIK